MNVADLWAQIEADQLWRVDEIRFFQNQLTVISVEDKQDQFRRALVLLLYAHFEGFCKFALSLYVSAVNSEEIKCGDANHAIAAASLADVFQALREPNSKCPEFRNPLPDDTKIHRFARDREFILRTQDISNRVVAIPDDVVDTESNLKPVVLRKNLYRLGFSHDKFRTVEGKIDRLLEFRNGIAHGKLRGGLTSTQYDDLRDAALGVMDEVKRVVMEALQNKEYLR